MPIVGTFAGGSTRGFGGIGGGGGGSILGTDSSNPAGSVGALWNAGIRDNGHYWIKAGNENARQFYCVLDAQFGGGGGWMIIANNAADAIITSGHIPRPTSFSSHVGGEGGVTETGLVPQYSFSQDMTNIPFRKFFHVVYDNQSMSTPSTDNWLSPLGYYGGTFNSDKTIPQASAWSHGFDSSSTPVLSFNGSNLNRRAGYGTGTSGGDHGCSGVGVWNNSGGSNPKIVGSGGNHYPVYCGVWSYSTSGAATAYSWTDYSTSTTGAYQGVGFDDWQDGTGMGDSWAIEGVGTNAFRGYPSYIMVQ